MDNLRSNAEKIVKEAGKLITETEIDRKRFVKKGKANYATQIDFMVQDFLLKELGRMIPGSNFITEESNANRLELDKPTWIIDPVDGTTNLMHRYKHSAISVALFTDSKPMLGVVYNPFLNEMFAGEKGKGAFLNDSRINVSKNSNLGDCLISFGTNPYDRKRAHITFKLAETVFMACREIRRSGVAALDIAYVACGRTDGFFEINLQPWDYAGGAIILREAGGTITNWEERDPAVLKPDSILATNGLIHKSMLEFLC